MNKDYYTIDEAYSLFGIRSAFIRKEMNSIAEKLQYKYACKKMNHETIVDVEALINKRIKELVLHKITISGDSTLAAKTQVIINELRDIKAELEKLKI